MQLDSRADIGLPAFNVRDLGKRRDELRWRLRSRFKSPDPSPARPRKLPRVTCGVDFDNELSKIRNGRAMSPDQNALDQIAPFRPLTENLTALLMANVSLSEPVQVAEISTDRTG